MTLHLVLMGCAAPGRFRRIRNLLFSDLSEKKEKYTYPLHIYMPDICIGKAYAYTLHQHMLSLYIYTISTYTGHMRIPDAYYRPERSGLRENHHENRIDI
ncbi:hypothetical protein FYO98_21040 [Salmonella enterica]|nr:hypothetical protein [Salmonella enterica]ECK2646910.1 hypothetical protein [Salmonella enterica]ECK5795202.1 hypothetical protein [Salmonella enterica]ECP1022884.1 hypothetical protein [Salmonella enterica]ECP2557388.1 hypothetical protein [Salmonella enterica]